MKNDTEKLKNIKDHFDRRALGFEEYSDWCRNIDLFTLCIKPFSHVDNLCCLDLGGGSGWIPRRDLETSRRRWFILDISFQMARYSNGKIPFVNGDAHYLPFKKCCFDVVLIRSVLHYVDASTVLKGVNAILRKNGDLVIAQKVALQSELNSKWYKKLLEFRRTHAVVIWTIDSLKTVLEENGFKLDGSTIYRERRKVDYRRWLSRDDTIPVSLQERIDKLVTSIPAEERVALRLSLMDNWLEYDRNWAVIYSYK